MDALTSVTGPVHVLAIGPHPDDIEIGIGGIVAKHASAGHVVGLCDLTAGDMGSNGTPEDRRAEAEAARRVLGAAWRVNLGLPDRAIGSEPSHVRVIAGLIRRARPQVVAVPYWSDRHPDHESSSRLAAEGVFNAALRRYQADGDPWAPRSVCYYFINDLAAPSFVVDVSEQYETKRRALACHASQFGPSGPEAVPTRLTSARFRQLIESRDAQFGPAAGVAFAEGVVLKAPPLMRHLLPE